MRIIVATLLLLVSSICFSQDKQYVYYFDKDLRPADKAHAVFYGTGQKENGLVKLMLYNSSDKHLLLTEHFTDSTLQEAQGLFTSFFTAGTKESEGNYAGGRQDGDWVTWNADGDVIDSSVFENGQAIKSTSFTYFTKGKRESVIYNDLKNHKFQRTTYDKENKIVREDTTSQDEDKIFTKMEIEPQFPGGERAWDLYIKKQVAAHKDEADAARGSCRLRFIVDTSGKVSEITPIACTNSWLAGIGKDALKNGPGWVCGLQNGRKVKAYKIETVSYTGKDD
jgi:hypothetical protein